MYGNTIHVHGNTNKDYCIIILYHQKALLIIVLYIYIVSESFAHINARHSSALAKKISSDDMSELQPVVFVAKGARVMLTKNLWSSVGLCNEATDTVIDIVHENNHQLPDLPVAEIVEFKNYREPVFNENQPLCIPIYSITVTSKTEIGFHERQQLPLRLAWANSTQEPRTNTSKSMDI